MHDHDDEVFVALDNGLEVLRNGHWEKLVCGQPCYSRHGELHAFRNTGVLVARMMVFVTPGGLDEYLERISRLELPQDTHQLFAVSAHAGISFPHQELPVSEEALSAAV